MLTVVLPEWLQYKVVSVADADTITKLNIFYSSDTEPADGTVGHVRILVGAFYGTALTKYDPGEDGIAASAAEGMNAAAGEEGSITPDADDASVALARVNGTTLTDGTTYNVEFGVIPEGATEEIRGSLGTLTGGSETILGVGSASSGCDAGLGMLVSALAAAFFIGRKRS